MKIRATSKSAKPEANQALSGAQSGNANANADTKLGQEFSAALAKYAGAAQLDQSTNGTLELDVFDVEPLEPKAPPVEPTIIQAATEAAALRPSTADRVTPRSSDSKQEADSKAAPQVTANASVQNADQQQTTTSAQAAAQQQTEKQSAEPDAASTVASAPAATLTTAVDKEASVDAASQRVMSSEEETVAAPVPAMPETSEVQLPQDKSMVTAQKPLTVDTSGGQSGKQPQAQAQQAQAQETAKPIEAGAIEEVQSVSSVPKKENAAPESPKEIGAPTQSAVAPVDVPAPNLAALAAQLALGVGSSGGHTSDISQSISTRAAAGLERTVEGLQSSSAKAQSNNGSALASGMRFEGTKTEARKEASKSAAPRIQPAKILERVEATLKEAAKARDGKTISFRLDPPELGKLKVDVSLRDGALHARVSSENAQVAQILREKAHDLQSTLRKLGLEVEKVSVSIHSEVSGSGQEAGNEAKFEFSDKESRDSKQGTNFGSLGSFDAPMSVGEEKAALDHWVA